MAQIDHSIYFRQQAPDIFGNLSRGMQSGMKMGQLMRQKKAEEAELLKQQRIKGAYSSNTNEQGEINQAGLVKDLMGIDPQMGMKARREIPAMLHDEKKRVHEESQWEAQEKQRKFLEAKQKNDMGARILNGVNDQKTWNIARRDLVANGYFEENEVPIAYTPGWVNSIKSRALSAKEQFDKIARDRGFELDKKYKEGMLEAKKKDSEAKAIESKNKAKKEGQKLAMDLRKERNSLPTTKDTQALSAAFNKVQNSASEPSAAGDLALIFNFMKMLDPQSVVREGEFKSAQQARAWMTKTEKDGKAIPGFVKQGIQKLESGQILLPEQRTDFISRAKGIYRAQKDIQDRVDSQYKGIAQKYQIPEDEIIVDFSANGMTREDKIERLKQLEGSE